LSIKKRRFIDARRRNLADFLHYGHGYLSRLSLVPEWNLIFSTAEMFIIFICDLFHSLAKMVRLINTEKKNSRQQVFSNSKWIHYARNLWDMSSTVGSVTSHSKWYSLVELNSIHLVFLRIGTHCSSTRSHIRLSFILNKQIKGRRSAPFWVKIMKESDQIWTHISVGLLRQIKDRDA
jgi:hypothetical protein